jgi:hypothetical protein
MSGFLNAPRAETLLKAILALLGSVFVNRYVSGSAGKKMRLLTRAQFGGQ